MCIRDRDAVEKAVGGKQQSLRGVERELDDQRRKLGQATEQIRKLEKDVAEAKDKLQCALERISKLEEIQSQPICSIIPPAPPAAAVEEKKAEKKKRQGRRCKKCWRPVSVFPWNQHHLGYAPPLPPEQFCSNENDKHPLYNPDIVMPRQSIIDKWVHDQSADTTAPNVK